MSLKIVIGAGTWYYGVFRFGLRIRDSSTGDEDFPLHRINVTINLNLVPDVTSAENVQDAANLAYGGTPFGFKVGATSEMAQELLAAPGPFFGVMVDIDRYDDGETIAW